MASKDLDSEDVKKQELDDITTCCICTEVYTNPKALPCIHTFCMKCIQETGLNTNKAPGDEMPCPICRQMFTIPVEGFHGLPKNRFIERLLQVANASHSSTVSRAVCDACLEDENEGMRKEIPSAEKYCVDCKRKLCEECCSEHSKFKLTKKHELIPMAEYESGQQVMTNIAPGVCALHEQKVLDVYCTDCKTVVCAICFIHDHRNHEGSHVDIFAADFRRQIESVVEVISECRSMAETKQAELMKLKEDVEEKVESLESDVEKRKDELKKLIEGHATSILQDLCLIRQSKMKEIQVETDDIDTYLSSLETYKSYCQNIRTKGSASDVCNALSELFTRAAELQHQCQLTNDIEIQSITFFFGKSEVEQFLTESCDNLIGEIQKEGVSKRKKTDKQIVLSEQSSGSELRSLRSENEQLRIEINNEIQTNKAHKMTIKILEDSVDKLEREISRMKQDQLQYIGLGLSDPVLIRTLKTKSAKDSKKAIYGLTILDKELFVVSRGSSDVEVYDSVNLSLSRRWNLKELIDMVDVGSCIINKSLYILDYKDYGQSAEILRVDPNGKLIRKWSTGYICGCLSVTDESNVILADYCAYKLNEYSPDGQLIHEINLLTNAGIRYPRHAIKLTNDLFVVSQGYFDAGVGGSSDNAADEDNDDDGAYDDDNDDRQRVCIVDADGKLQKSFGGKRGSSIKQLNDPVHLSVDGNGFIMVADRGNSRVLLLDSDLKFKRDILWKEKHGLRHPSRTLLNECSGRLFVVDNERNPERMPFVDGQMLIFDF